MSVRTCLIAALHLALVLLVSNLSCGALAKSLEITKIEPTPLFPKAKAGEPLRQVVRLSLNNAGGETEARVKIMLPDVPVSEQPLGKIGPGATSTDIRVAEIVRPTELTVELYATGAGQPADVKKVLLQPQKKWCIYCVSYSHHDLGFGNYPHRLRTDIRHANIERPLQFCRETDSWDADSRFRYMIETSEPITSFLGSHSEADAAELARRIREGRIQIGAIHTTVNSEQMSHELLARLLYLTNRHACDLLDVPRSRTGQIDDVIGLTWPLATICREADVPYFFHGHNGTADCFRPASAEAVFNWQGPDGRSKILVRSTAYGGYAGDSIGDGSERHIETAIAKFAGPTWPYSVMLLQDGTDFQLATKDAADKIHAWNARWSYPRLICATMDMFFDAVAAQADPAKIKTFAKDGNNQWADQDSAAAMTLAEARRQGEAIPTAEKLATIAATLAGGDYPWTDVYQAYHRLLLYHEHTDGADNAFDASRENTQRCETEQAEMREMVDDARFFADRARRNALERLAGLVATSAKQTVIVFNPLSHSRTDLVRVPAAALTADPGLIDVATNAAVPMQRDDSQFCFVAADVPSLGYKCYRVVTASDRAMPANEKTPKNASTAEPAEDNVLENRFYRVQFDPKLGTIASIFDKQLNVELVDQAAPHKFNQYLYERFERPNIKDGSTWYRPQSARLRRSVGPVAARMTATSSAVGADKIEQSVILYNDLKRIDFVLDLVKARSGRDRPELAGDLRNKESVYMALPWEIPDFSIHHEMPGCVEEPVKDLFQGACTAFYAVRHFSDVSGPRYGVTVSAPDSSLIEYGRPRSCPNPIGRLAIDGSSYEMDMTPPPNSRMYLYLMNNMFDTNIPLDQHGPARFTWSMRSHPGDWREGQADQFGWETMNPLLATVVVGRQKGTLPESQSSFLAVDRANVVCTTIKPAEANGRGIVLRFVETHGKATTASFQAAFLAKPEQAIETNLLEEDRQPLPITADGRVTIALQPFGVKTVRLVSAAKHLSPPEGLTAKPLSDMEVALQWTPAETGAETLGCYRVYRGTKPDFRPGLLNLVRQVPGTSVVDRPILHFGGWINNRLEPETTYYYRVSWLDRWNNESPASAAVMATTLKSSVQSAVPNRVERLSAIPVIPLGQREHVNLLFRTNCESDVVRYEIHRSTSAGFVPNETTRIGEVSADAIIKGSAAYGHTPIDRRAREYDHIMYQDDAVEPYTTYYYRVRAVDASGQKGPFSRAAAVNVEDPFMALGRGITAQSLYAPEFGPVLAIDGSTDPCHAWISKPYGGGTKPNPRDVWWAIAFPAKKTIRIKGIKIVGDHRDVIPLQKNLKVQVLQNGSWKTVAQVRDASQKDILATWPEPLDAAGIRIVIPAADLPRSDRPEVDGIVRICELLLVLPDGRDVGSADWF
jgi:hypothetical protein